VGNPETRYAKTADGVHIAYQVAGEGPLDLVVLASALGLGRIWTSRHAWNFPQRFTAFSRLILLDRRGTGLSDHILESERQLTLESQMDDVRAVMDAAGSDRAVLFGMESGFAVAAMFAATLPERTAGLIAYGAQARALWASDYPFGRPKSDFDAEIREMERGWGTPAVARLWLSDLHPSVKDDPLEIEDLVRWMQAVGGPGDAIRWARVDNDLDLRDILPSVRVPTLILHRTGDLVTPIENGRYLAAHIPGAELRELPGENHMWDTSEEVPVEVERFVTGLHREEMELDRYLATVLFTDIVESTAVASAGGDAAWGSLVEEHHRVVRGALARYRGTEVDTAGDGFFATFEGPARAVGCARSIVKAVEPLGLRVRAGIHVGEVETIDDKVGGIAVAIGARICALAGASQVLASSTVKDLTAGSGLEFEDAGEHELKGVPDRWRLYRVTS
jgi:pimeloyl-ACP methyl ester carboxylesterase